MCMLLNMEYYTIHSFIRDGFQQLSSFFTSVIITTVYCSVYVKNKMFVDQFFSLIFDRLVRNMLVKVLLRIAITSSFGMKSYQALMIKSKSASF